MADIVTSVEQIRERILQRLASDWGPGTRLPPVPELAQRLGAGQRNTYLAARELVDAGLLTSRRGTGTFVSRRYTPDALQDAARQMLGAHTSALAGRTVGIVTSGHHRDGLFQEMIDALTAPLAKAGLRTEAMTLPKRNRLDSAAYQHADALVLVNPNTSTPVIFNPRQSVVIVSTTAAVRVGVASNYDLVAADEQQGGLLAGLHLRGLGCRSACFVGATDPDHPSQYDATSGMRLRGFEVGFGRSLPPAHRLQARGYGLSGARTVIDYHCLTRRPTAVFAASDELAVAFIAGSLAMGLTPGEDYQIIGFDGQHQHRHAAEWTLTSVAVDAARMGTEAAALLLSRMSEPSLGPRRLSLGCHLFEGGTARRRRRDAASRREESEV